MDKENIILKSTFRGMLNDIIKRAVELIIILLCLLKANSIRKEVSDGISLKSLLSSSSEMDTLIYTLAIFAVIVVLSILALIVIFKTIMIMFELSTCIEINLNEKKIIIHKVEFPLMKIMDENKFNEIIEVGIFQKTLDRVFNTGHLYVEYLVQSKVDSKIRTVYVPYVIDPEEQKKLIM